MPTLSSQTAELRKQVLEAAKRHKASWIELGQYLAAVFREKFYRDWGYSSFEGYCMKELGVKEATASKLIKSYRFLAEEEPRLASPNRAAESGPREVPHYEAVNLLRLAKHNKNVSPREYSGIREAVLTEGKEPQEIRAEMRRILDAGEERPPAQVRRDRRNAMIRRLVSTLRSMERQCASERLLPGSVLKDISALADELEGQVE